MPRQIEIIVDPDNIKDPEHIRRKIMTQAPGGFDAYRLLRRSIDARRSRPRFRLQVELDPDVTPPEFNFVPVPAQPSAVIVGAGPAGYFAALELIERGVKPIVLERGPAVERSQPSSLLPAKRYCCLSGAATSPAKKTTGIPPRST